MKTSILRALIVTTALCCFSASALAQYVWLDANGSKQFSDQPPPASVPKNKILKAPGKSFDSQSAGDAVDGDAQKAAKPPENIADKELAYKKRHDEMAAKDKKSEEEAKTAAAKADNCKRMREYKTTLDSGQRIAQVDANGNRSFMADDKRAQEQSTLSQGMSECGN
jgi:hypothetical protein